MCPPEPMPALQLFTQPSPLDDVSSGSNRSKILRVTSGSGKRALGAWVYIPAWIAPGTAPLVAVHGISRRAKEQVRNFANAAERTGRIVVAPLFDRCLWNNYQRISNKNRGDRALLDLLARIETLGIARTQKFDLFGYSGGAQFVHRFAMLFPRRIGRLSIAAAGWYCMPDAEIAYPYGLAARPGRNTGWGPRMLAELDAYLRLPISIFVGADDTVQDRVLRRSPHLDAIQGKNRLERARAYHAALSAMAHQRAIGAQFSLTLLKDSGHRFPQCVNAGGLDRLVLG